MIENTITTMKYISDINRNYSFMGKEFSIIYNIVVYIRDTYRGKDRISVGQKLLQGILDNTDIEKLEHLTIE